MQAHNNVILAANYKRHVGVVGCMSTKHWYMTLEDPHSSAQDLRDLRCELASQKSPQMIQELDPRIGMVAGTLAISRSDQGLGAVDEIPQMVPPKSFEWGLFAFVLQTGESAGESTDGEIAE